jgi:ATP-dependent DNA helicase DinG
MRIFKQGDMPRTKLIEEFKKDRDSVLFATRSFFTGVDIPGDSLRCLMIDKFPFPSPGDPVMMKIQKLYGDKTFSKHYIPEMVITLKQAVGRGVRTITDKCVIVILDGRMVTSSYKGSIFNSFPYDKTGTRDIEDVKKFLEG